MFFYRYYGTACRVETLCKKNFCRLNRKIPVIIRNEAKICARAYLARFVELNMYVVTQGDALHYHNHIMITVIPLVADIKRNVQFCVCFFINYVYHLK